MRSIFLLIIFLTACVSTPTPPPTPVPTPTPADEYAIFRQGLISASQNDFALLDRPSHYDLDLRYDATGPTLAGIQNVRYTNRQSVALNEIYFRLFANYPNSGAKLVVANVTVDDTAAVTALEVQNTVLKLPLAKALTPGATLKIHLEWTLTIPPVGKVHYADFGTADSVVALPSVIPLIPAYDAKGWHIELPPAYGDLVYAEMALFDVKLTTPAKLTAITSGSTIESRDNGDGTRTLRIVGAPMRDFDINLTDQLQKATQVVGETTINSWYEPNDAESGKKALQVSADAFKTFTARFGAYPYRELDVIETPTTAGGIEYPGVIVIARNLYRGQREREFFEFATAHEVAHQWWYGLVGDDQVNTPWVDEALAQYATLIYSEDIRGASVGQAVLKQQFQAAYDRAKKDGRDAVVNQPVAAFDERAYGEIVYGKGPLFFDAIRKKMGDEKFFQYLRTYFDRFRYRIATPEDVIKTAEEVYGQSLRAEYQQWILGK